MSVSANPIPSPAPKYSLAMFAAADDGHLVVGRERLVMHPPVEPREVGHVCERARVALREGVVQADLDVRMSVESGDRCVVALRVCVVE
jgi:hypothetical protein